jgi:hypothetical protein
MNGGDEACFFFIEDPEGRDQLVDLGVDGRKILKRTLKNRM